MNQDQAEDSKNSAQNINNHSQLEEEESKFIPDINPSKPSKHNPENKKKKHPHHHGKRKQDRGEEENDDTELKDNENVIYKGLRTYHQIMHIITREPEEHNFNQFLSQHHPKHSNHSINSNQSNQSFDEIHDSLNKSLLVDVNVPTTTSNFLTFINVWGFLEWGLVFWFF